MATWLVPRDSLTTEQLRAVMLPANEHKVVVGAPGSGKTLTLIHRAAYLRDHLHLGDDRFRIFVYTNALRDYIDSALKMLSIPSDCVVGFDHWCRLFYEEKVNRRAPWDAQRRAPDFNAIREGVLDHLSNNPENKPLYDAIMVDEGQDLTETAYKILRRIGRHITVSMDHRQQIYDHGLREPQILDFLGLRRNNLALLEAYRCCPYISRIAATFIADERERASYLRQTKTEQVERETPLLYLSDSADDERERLIEVVRTRLLKGDRIAILFPQTRLVYGYSRALADAGLEVEVLRKRTDQDGPFEALDFASERPKLMTYHSAKGLTFDSVFLPRLSPHYFANLSPERLKSLLFVGITRASRWLYLSAPQGRELPLLETIRSLVGPGCLTVRRSGDSGVGVEQGGSMTGTPEVEGVPIKGQPPAADDDLRSVF